MLSRRMDTNHTMRCLLDRNGYDPTKNADNYAWYAVESFLLKSNICGDRKGWTDFEDPISN